MDYRNRIIAGLATETTAGWSDESSVTTTNPPRRHQLAGGARSARFLGV